MKLYEVSGKKPMELAKELFQDIVDALVAADIEHVDDITTINVAQGTDMTVSPPVNASTFVVVLPASEESELRARLLMRTLARVHWIERTEDAALADMLWIKAHVKSNVETRFISLLDGLVEEFMARITAAKAIEQQNRPIADLAQQVLRKS